MEGEDPKPGLEVRLFGAMEVAVAGRPIPPPRSRAEQWLLALLVLRHGRPADRAWLAATLWPDSSEGLGLFYLRRSLTNLRHALGAEGHRLEVVPPHGLRLVLGGAFCDLATFDEAVATRQEEGLAAAVALYRGQLLEGCQEEWALPERRAREEAYLDALEVLAARSEACGDHTAEVHSLRRLLTVDPVRESAVQRLMGALAAQGDYAGVVRAYREFRLCLHDEFHSQPAAETAALYQRLRAEGRQSPPAPRSHPVDSASPPPESVPDDGDPCPDGGGLPREPVGGAVPLDSAFYLTRPADGQFLEAVARRDSIVLIKGPRQIGKTSLLARGLQAARDTGARVVYGDFQALNAEHLASTGTLMLALATTLATRLGLGLAFRKDWDPDLGANMNMEDFLEAHALAEGDGPLVWGLDEVDRLFACDFAGEVFGLFRSWHNRRALDPGGPWSRLTLAMAYATEAHLFIADLNQSPFNVGTRLTLDDFTSGQVAELDRRYGAPLRGDADQMARFCRLVGGHPYLVRRGLDWLASRRESVGGLEAQADREDGPFGDHLRRLLISLTRDTPLTDAVRGLLRGEPIATPEAFFRLRSAGLLSGTSAVDAGFRCQLYETHLGRHLLH